MGFTHGENCNFVCGCFPLKHTYINKPPAFELYPPTFAGVITKRDMKCVGQADRQNERRVSR